MRLLIAIRNPCLKKAPKKNNNSFLAAPFIDSRMGFGLCGFFFYWHCYFNVLFT